MLASNSSDLEKINQTVRRSANRRIRAPSERRSNPTQRNQSAKIRSATEQGRKEEGERRISTARVDSCDAGRISNLAINMLTIATTSTLHLALLIDSITR